MGIRGASWWISLPGWRLFHSHNHRPLQRRKCHEHKCGANAESTAFLITQTNEWRIQPLGKELHFLVRGVLELTWQEINEKGRHWETLSISRKHEQLHQDGEKGKSNLLCLCGSHAETSYIVIKKNTEILVVASFGLLSQYYEFL